MTGAAETALVALELLPEEMREPAVAYLIEQAEKYRTLKELVAEGIGMLTRLRFGMELRSVPTVRVPRK
jgi:hypothetical protein